MGFYPLLQFPTGIKFFYFGYDKEIGSAQLIEGFPQRTPGEQVAIPEPGLGIHEEDIHIPVDPQVLISIVQDGHTGMKLGSGVPTREIAATADNNGNTLEPLSQHVRFIPRRTK
jgi:hypothetical protein